MKCNRVCLYLFLAATLALGQQPLTTATQLQTVQSQAHSALMGAALPTSIALDGTFTSIAGSVTQNGNAHITVGSDGSSLINLSRSVGPTSESRAVSDGIPACTWTDQGGVVHDSSFLNCMPSPWVFPGLTLLTPTSDASLPAWTPSSYSVDSLGDHLRFQFVLPNLNGAPTDPQLSNPFDLVLAPDTLLPQYAFFHNTS